MSEPLPSIAEQLGEADRLAGVSDSPRLDLQLLLADALGKPRSYLYAWPERRLSGDEHARFQDHLRRRLAGEPVAHILGRQGFWTLELEVSPATLIPRPETERLVELALELGPAGAARIADLGTGTGAIALALASERPQWAVDAVERHPQAAALAERNRNRLGLDNVRVLRGSWFEPLSGRYHLILSNPPYIDAADPHLRQGDVRFEPASALVAEESGLADIRHLASRAGEFLHDGGCLLLEHGWNQGAAVRTLLLEHGFADVRTERDLGERERVTLGFWRAR